MYSIPKPQQSHQWFFDPDLDPLYFHGRSKVPIPALALDDNLPTDLTDLELFRKFCMPFHETDRWEEAIWSH